MDYPLFERITIIGLGLIGSSLARAVKQHALAGTIIGCDMNEVSLAYGRKHEFIDMAVRDPLSAVTDSNLVILATPIHTYGDIMRAIAPNLRPGSIIMDMASVKRPAIEAITPHLPNDVELIPTHPIAGSEQSGVSAGRADLFNHKQIIVSPHEPLRDHLLQTVVKFWQAMGARVEGMPADLHDLVYAYVSHLPQLLAFALPNALKQNDGQQALARFTRLTHSNPALWVDIYGYNHDNVLKALNRYLDVINHIQKELNQAPAEETAVIGETSEALALCALFPRIAAACLITTVMEAGKQTGFSFARYGGTGFSDFTSPAAQSPEEDIENISAHYFTVARLLENYANRLRTIHDALASQDADKLLSALSMQSSA